MLKKSLQLGIVLFIGSGAFAQWEGSNTIDNPIWRDGAIGIGSHLFNGHITFGSMGTHLSIGRSEYTNQTILATGWIPGSGDYTDIRVPGTELNNNARLRMFHTGFVGIGTEQPREKLQIGTRFLFHDGGSKKISYNSYWDFQNGVSKRVEDAPVSEMEYTAEGAIRFSVAPYGASNSVVDNYNTAVVIANNGNVGIGTPNPGSFKLAVEGSICAREVRVTLQNPFPDYVFGSKYKLRDLDSLKNFIDINKHLPGIPSAAEVESNGGVELGKLNNKMLEKIEELTLYVLELNNQIKDLKKENQELKNKFGNSK